MKLRHLPFLGALAIATAFVVGCGDQNPPNHLTEAEQFRLKQMLMQQQLGSSGTTNTSTVVQYVTITNTTTVPH
jgi:hypothetical protein